MITFAPLLLRALPYIAAFAVGSFSGYKVAESIWTSKYNTLQNKLIAIEKKQQELIVLNKELEKKASEKTIEYVTVYVDKIRKIKVKGDTIIKKVPIYVTKIADDQCNVTDGWVYVHDAAASGSTATSPVSKAPEDPNGKTSGVRLSKATETIIGNYNKYHEVAEQLRQLQDWITAQEQIYNSTKK